MTERATAIDRSFALLVVASGFGLLAYASLFGRIHYRLFDYLWQSAYGWTLLFVILALGIGKRWYLALFVGKYVGLFGVAVMLVSAIAALIAPDEVVITLFRRELGGYLAAFIASLLAVYSYWLYRVLSWHELAVALRLR